MATIAFAASLTGLRAALALLHHRYSDSEWGRLLIALPGWVAGFSLVAALLVRPFLCDIYQIPSESMSPALKKGDFVLVNKLAYLFGKPNRNDLVVFEAPHEELRAQSQHVDYIKRVIGLQGDRVEVRSGVVLINGSVVNEPYVRDPGKLNYKIVWHHGAIWPVLSRELELNSYRLVSAKFVVTNRYASEVLRRAPPVAIPKGSVILMGDNRVASTDSRAWGPIRTSTIFGKVSLVLMPIHRFGILRMH